MTAAPRVLIADDDTVLSEMLSEYLTSEGCQTDRVSDGQQAVDRVASNQFDIVVLDIMMPVLNGIEALKRIRQQHSIPVIMLTARGDDLDRILGLELGADDYLAKPCNPRELFARIKAVLRRATPGNTEFTENLSVGDLSLDPGMRKVTLGAQQDIVLTQTEFDLLYMLLSSSGRAVTRSEMSMKVLEKPLSQWDRSIDVHISNLRKKLGSYPGGGPRIRTLRGSGYLYVTESSSS